MFEIGAQTGFFLDPVVTQSDESRMVPRLPDEQFFIDVFLFCYVFLQGIQFSVALFLNDSQLSITAVRVSSYVLVCLLQLLFNIAVRLAFTH